MKKFISIALVFVFVFSMAMPVMALNWDNGAGFHCNAGKGNGRVITGAEAQPLNLSRVGTSTVWNVVTSAADAIVCPTCARIDWVTFSNKNGVINGKNIQINHSANPVYLAKASATLVLQLRTINECDETDETITVDTITKTGTFRTDEIASFTFDIDGDVYEIVSPEGLEIVDGTVTVTLPAFEAAPGQKLSATVVALETVIIECECGTEECDCECTCECGCYEYDVEKNYLAGIDTRIRNNSDSAHNDRWSEVGFVYAGFGSQDFDFTVSADFWTLNESFTVLLEIPNGHGGSRTRTFTAEDFNGLTFSEATPSNMNGMTLIGLDRYEEYKEWTTVSVTCGLCKDGCTSCYFCEECLAA